MSRPQSKRDLAEAGRRKLEAFRAQKAAAKALKAAPAQQPALTLQGDRDSASSSRAGLADNTGSDLLSRAASVLPLSTHAGPINSGGSDEEAPPNRKFVLPQVPAGKATAQSAPTFPVPFIAEPPVRIPFTGPDSTDSSSTQQPTPQPAGAAAVAANSSPSPAVPVKYQSRLPPPPPVFKPPSRLQAGSLQSSGNSSGSFQLPRPLPFRSAVVTGGAKAVSPSGQAHSGQAPFHAQVQMFNPAKGDSSGSPSSQQQAAPLVRTGSTVAKTTGLRQHAWSLFGGAHSTKEPTDAAEAADDVSAEAAKAAAELSGADEASQLTLVSDRQVLPEVSTGRVADTAGTPGEALGVSLSRGAVSPSSEQDHVKPPDSRSNKVSLPTFPESPDSPLVFPWSQGPSSTGAASAYASLSDSYLSRPPSQTPSQAPSPSKQGQHLTPSAVSPTKHALPESSRLLSAQHAKHAQQELTGGNSPPHAASTAAGSSPSRSSKTKRPFDLMWGDHQSDIRQGVSPLGRALPTGRAFQTLSNGQVGSPSGPALPIGQAFQTVSNEQVASPSGPALPTGHAFQALSNGPLSNGPVSVAPWRQPSHSGSATARPPSPPLGSPAATARLQSPQLGSPAATAAHVPSNRPQVSQGMLHSTRAVRHLGAGGAGQPTTPASESPSNRTKMEHQQPVGLAQHESSLKFPWEKRRPMFDGLPQLNGRRNSQNDAASSASGDSSTGTARSDAGATGSATAGATAGVAAVDTLQDVDRSMHALHKGMGSHASLADSLANGTLPGRRSKFTALQQHIDDLTKEKFELVRGLQEQQKMAASLADENLVVTDDFNRQAEALQQTRRELSQLEEEVRHQQEAMEHLAAERDACKSGAHEASDRSKSLAAEVVALEEKVLLTRSREIRLQKDTANLQEGLQQAEKQLQASRRDRDSLQSTIEMLQEEKGALLARLRQAALRSGAEQPGQATHAGWQEEEADSNHGTAPQQTAAVDQPAAAMHGRGAPISTDSEGHISRQRSGAGVSTSARLVEQVLIRHQNQHDQAGSIAMQDALPHSLASLFPAASSGGEGGVAGGEGGVAEQQQQLLQSIHAIIADLEAEKRSFLGMLDSSQAEVQDLRFANSELQRKLESQTQRLELVIQQQAHASPHASSPSSYAVQAAHHPAVPQLQQPGPVFNQPKPQLWPDSQALSALQHQQQQPLAEDEVRIQSEEQQQQPQSPPYPAGYARSAPPTPQHEEARKLLRVPAGGPPSGVLGWLGNIIAPRPQPRHQELMI